MKGVYLQQNSPYYWLRYYDKLEPDPSRKRKSVNTKIPISTADQRRAQQKKRLEGNPELRRLVKSFKDGLAERDIQARSGVKLKKDLKLSEGYTEFKEVKSVPGSRGQIKTKTIKSYDLAVDHFIKSCGDKKIYKYTDKDYQSLLYYFEHRKIPGKTKRNKKNEILETEYKPMSMNSRAIYTRSLHAIWNYFIEKNYTAKNVIEVIRQEKTNPEPIDHEDMFTILQYLKEEKDYPHQYQVIYFLLLTGCRPSSAMVQLKEDIDFKKKIIKIQNVKTGQRKGDQYYKFPLYKELEQLLKEMKVKPEDQGRLFDMYAEVPGNYTSPLSFWKRKIGFLVKAKKISREYNVKQIRPTLASFLINNLGMDIFTVQKLLDHSDIKVTDKHYVDFNLGTVRKNLDQVEEKMFIGE